MFEAHRAAAQDDRHHDGASELAGMALRMALRMAATAEWEDRAEDSGELLNPCSTAYRLFIEIGFADKKLPEAGGSTGFLWRSSYPLPQRPEFAFGVVEPVEQADNVAYSVEAYLLMPAEVLDVPQAGDCDFVELWRSIDFVAETADEVCAHEFEDHFRMYAREFCCPIKTELSLEM